MKLTTQQKCDIVRLYQGGWKARLIAQMFDVSLDTVYQHIRRRTRPAGDPGKPPIKEGTHP